MEAPIQTAPRASSHRVNACVVSHRNAGSYTHVVSGDSVISLIAFLLCEFVVVCSCCCCWVSDMVFVFRVVDGMVMVMGDRLRTSRDVGPAAPCYKCHRCAGRRERCCRKCGTGSRQEARFDYEDEGKSELVPARKERRSSVGDLRWVMKPVRGAREVRMGCQ
ncbi:hypothetical protein DFH94DRAFT_767511 [Russula ochroleuca]|uniref:Uncharacterized protein n=1 Tax=Russula ochroleuca TaxID=152965 RepID=A0A9P5K016_9AGAM|nr:hypothetical protein DFH94DRAFT_767511 [Russula ochroleuca]